MLTFNKPTFEETSQKEWLLTNGIGGYASGTISGANTRRYHGLLVASLNPPTQRQVLVSKIEESITLKRDTCVEFSSNRYTGAIHPQGFQYIKSFERSPLPRTVYQIGGNLVAKTIFMVHGSNTTVVEYENLGKSSYQLKLTPFFADRDYHSLFHENPKFDYYYEEQQNVLKIHSHYGSQPLFFKFFDGNFIEDRHWFKNFAYEKEAYRGLDYQEDAYALGEVSFVLKPGEKNFLMFTQGRGLLSDDPAFLKEQALKRLKALSPQNSNNPFFKDLSIAGDQFIVHRHSTNSYSVIAGYHWFTDWGRDTMIAMRGLCIATGKKEISQSILETFFKNLSEGMLPNRFPDSGADGVEYNTVDATLWLFIALFEFYEKFQDKTFIKANFDKLTSIIQWHLKGTRYNIHITEEGFLYAGEGNVQLTWMDARVGDYVVTPRRGCPVEIQALWFNALKIYLYFTEELDISSNMDLFNTCNDLSEKLAQNFRLHFLNQEGYLNDVVNPGTSVDHSIRPNQIYALSLPFSLLKKREAQSVFQVVKEELFTPLGLRTLNTDHPNFKPVYKGDQWQRDTAYHQGTVWPFLLGDYFQAQLKVSDNREKVIGEIEKSLEALQQHFYEQDCIHGISEIFDGLKPNDGRGTIQQAWSIGALLKIMIEAGLERISTRKSSSKVKYKKVVA